MRKLLSFLCFCLPAQAVLSISVNSGQTTQTQAVVQISGASGACTIRLSTAAGFTPLHPDVDSAKYASANLDTSRADTITWANGTRLVTLGHMTDDRALAADTQYYVEVSVCGTTQTASFRTATLQIGTTLTYPIPTNSSNWANTGFPKVDWSLGKNQTLIDPMTGVKIKLINAGNDWSWRTGGGAAGLQSGYYLTFADYAGGSGWTTPGTITAGATTAASTGNTNPVDLYVDTQATNIYPYDNTTSLRVLDDIGIVPWGSGTDATAANRQFTACIFKNPGDGCFSPTVTITAPTGSVASIHSSTTTNDPDFAFPATFPKPSFSSWGDFLHYLRVEDYETAGTLTIGAAGALTITSPGARNHFSTALKAGARIYIAGTSPTCTNNLCTIASITDPGHATISEAPSTAAGVAFRAYGWGIRIQKTTATGTLTVGAQYKLAGSVGTLEQSLGDHCSTVLVTSGDGKTGHICEVIFNNAEDFIYFFATDGTIRGVSRLMRPARIHNIGGGAASNPADYPYIAYNAQAPIGFDPTDGKTWYIGTGSNSGATKALWQVTYAGDFTTDFSQASNYTGDPDNMWLEELGGPNDQTTWTNLMPTSTGKDLVSQIATHSEYNATFYGNTWAFVGCSGAYCSFQNSYSGQGQSGAGGPGWVAIVNKSTGILAKLIHTLDGTGTTDTGFAKVKWASLHSAQQREFPASTIFLSTDSLYTNSTSVLHGGPFISQLTGVKRSGTFSADTSLPWPPDSSYDNTCPGGSPYANYGAAGNQCATFEMTVPCNAAATTAEKAQWPCVWNAAYSSPATWAVGDLIEDQTGYGSPCCNPDRERFRILSITATTGNKYSVVVQRDAIQDYGCQTGHGNLYRGTCAGSSPDAVHGNGWVPRMSPGGGNAASSASVLFGEIATDTWHEMGHDFAGHGESGTGPAGTMNYAQRDNSKYRIPLANIGDLPTTEFTLGDPAFAGMGASIGGGGGPQSYVYLGQYDQPNAPWGIDQNGLVYAGECPTCVLNSRTLTPISGNVYKTVAKDYFSNTYTLSRYKTWPPIPSAGPYNLKEVSGPSANIDSTPYTMCYVVTAGECHAGSLAGEVYVNVPQAYDPAGGCVPGMNWANIPCVLYGWPAPIGGVRQFDISKTSSAGTNSRFVSYAMTGPMHQYPFSHNTTEPTGNWAFGSGIGYVDGVKLGSWAVGLPTWDASGTPANDLVNYPVTVAAGAALAKVRFGYSRNIGPNAAPSTFACTNRTGDACTTAAVGGQPFTFESEAGTGTSCTSGCTIQVPTHQPNLMYYQTVRSSDGGATWITDTAAPNIQAVALGAPIVSTACSDLAFSPTTAAPVAAGATGSITVTVTDQTCSWSASSNAGWLTVTSGATGTGNGSLSWSAALNSGSQRIGIITPDSLTSSFTATQAAASVSPVSTVQGHVVTSGHISIQ